MIQLHSSLDCIYEDEFPVHQQFKLKNQQVAKTKIETINTGKKEGKHQKGTWKKSFLKWENILLM